VNRKYEGTSFRKEQIVRAAAELIVEYGSEHLTIKKLAAQIGLSEAAIYRHFCSKIEIYQYLIQYMEHLLLSELIFKEGQFKLIDLERLVKRHLSAIEKSCGIEFQIIAEIISVGDPKLNAEMYNTINRYLDRVELIIERGKYEGFVRETVDARNAATLFFSFIHGLVNLWVLSGRSFSLRQRFIGLWSFYRQVVIKVNSEGRGHARIAN